MTLSLANLPLLRFIRTVNEARHYVRVSLPFYIFGIPHNLPNDYSENGRTDEKFIVEFLCAKEPVQRLLHRHAYLEGFHMAIIIHSLVLPPELRVKNIMVLIVEILSEGGLENLVLIVSSRLDLILISRPK